MKTAEQLWAEWGNRFIESGLDGDELSDDDVRAASLEMVNGILREGYAHGFADAREASAECAEQYAMTGVPVAEAIRALEPKETP